MLRPKFSIIIPAQRIFPYLRKHLKEHLKQRFENFEIIVLSDIKEKEKFPKTRIITTGKVPPSKKRNIGAREAKGEILAFIDDDAYPLENWLEIANKEFEDKTIVAIGGPSLPPLTATFFQKVSNKVYELSSGKTGIRYYKSKRQNIEDWPTCNLFVRKKEFLEVGGSNEKYWGGEDTNLCYNLSKTKKKIIYVPEIAVFHHPRKKLKNHLKQSYFWGMWRGFFMKVFPRDSIRLTFFMPALFVLGLVVGAILSFVHPIFYYIYFSVLFLYLIFILWIGLRSRSLKLAVPVMLLSILSHIFYGVGFWKGILSRKDIGPTRSGMHSYENLTKRKQ